MEYRVAPGSRGLAWFQGGVRMLDRNPRGLIAVALVVMLLDQLPKLFDALSYPWVALSVLLSLLGPSLSGGLLFAIDETWQGRPVGSGHAFEGLRRPGARVQLLVLGMVGLVAMALAALAAWNIMGEDNIKIFGQVMTNAIKPDSPAAQAMALPFLKALMSALAIVFVWLVGVFFAVPRVMFDGRSALGALAESFGACAANVLALTVYGLVFAAAGFVLMVGFLVAAAFLTLLGQVGHVLIDLIAFVIGVVVLLVSTAGNYLAWREVFGHTDAAPTAPPQAGIIV